MNNLIIKGSIDTINKEERIFSGWGSIQIIDRQGDFINIDEFKPVVQRLLAMGHKIPIQDSHSNHNCGEIIKIEFLNTTEGQPGIYLTSKIYSRFPSDDDIWNAIKSGEYSGYSLGGKAGNKTPVCDQNGCYNLLTDIEIWEFSIVSTPANPGALITQVNKLAKGIKVQKARVYVKYPADAPQGSHIYTGDKGGKYYETEEIGNKSTREQIEREQKAPKIKVKSLQDVIGNESYNRMDKWREGRELKDLLNVYTKIATGTAKDEEINRSFEFIDKRLPEVYNFYVWAARDPTEEDTVNRSPEFRAEHKEVADNVKKVQNIFAQAKDRKDKVIAIDNFMNTSHTSGDNIVARLWNAWGSVKEKHDSDFVWVSDIPDKYMDYLRTNIGKSLIKAIPITKYIHQCGDKFCVYSEAGKKLGIHETKEDAHKQLYAIEINKDVTYRGGLLIDHDTEESVAPDGSIKPLTAKEHMEMIRTEEKLDSKKVQKARVYVKNPTDAPPGARLQEGKHGGHYYETEARQSSQQEAPKEKRNLDALNPRIYDNYDKLLHFETGKEVLINYLYNTEKAPNMGSRFGQDIEPSGKYVILNEMGVDETVIPPGWKKSAQILYNPLVLDWKDWKQCLSSFYGNLTGKNLSDALKSDGFDGIVTIDDQNVSEIILLKPRIESYNELKDTPYYKGSTEIYNNITKLSDKYDVFDVNAVRILVSANDLPTDIGNKVMECADSFKFSSLKSDKPVIKFLGKTYIRKFNWQDRDGKDHISNYGGIANYVSNEICIYDDYEMDGILHHEVGHFVYKQLMSSVDAKPDPSIKSIADIDSVNDYRKMVEILKTHNVPISSENIEKILDDINYVRELGIMEDMHTNNLTYYDKGYGALYGILHRLKENRDVNITPFEEKQWKKYRALRKQEFKSNTLRNEWLDIWQTEGYQSKEYANRNNNETFAEFYLSVDRILRYSDKNLKHQQLLRLAANHPLKWAFFKRHVVGKWLK